MVSDSTYPPVFRSTSSYPVDSGDSMFAEVFYAGGGTGDTYSTCLADSTPGVALRAELPVGRRASATAPWSVSRPATRPPARRS